MAQIIQDFLEYCGLNYQPQTFGDLITWFVAVLLVMNVLFGMLKSLISSSENLGRMLR